MKKLSLTELNRVDIATFKQQEKTRITLVLDNVRSALNVGAAFRTSDAFSLEKIILCGITAKPPHREILKTAIGATDSVTWEYLEETTTAIKALKAKDYKIIAIEQAVDSIPLQTYEVDKNQSYALIFGNEVKGVSNKVMEVIDECVEIPQFGTKHSLNISVCAGIVIWAFFRQMKF